MLHIRLFMELQSHPMAAQIAHNAETVLPGMLFDGISYIPHKAERTGSFHANLQALSRDVYQFLLLGCGLPDDKHTRSIAVISVQYGGNVHIDNISFLQYVEFIRNAVTDHLVNGSTYTFRKTFIIQRSRNGPVAYRIIIYHLVYLKCSHSGMYLLGHKVQHPGIYHTAPANPLYLFRSLNQFTRRHQTAFFLKSQNLTGQIRQFGSFRDNPIPSYLSSHSFFHRFIIQKYDKKITFRL